MRRKSVWVAGVLLLGLGAVALRWWPAADGGPAARADEPKKIAGMTPEQMARMEREMENLQRDLKTVESRYGEDVLQLVIASAYLSKLVANAEIRRYLSQHHPEILSEFRAIIAATSLDQASTT